MIGFRTVLSGGASSAGSCAPADGGLAGQDSSSVLRTLDDVRGQVAQEIAVRVVTQSEVLDGVRVGAALSLSSKSDDEDFLLRVADIISHQMLLHDHLFILSTTPPPLSPTFLLLISSSDPSLVQRAVLLTSAKLIGRVESAHLLDDIWLATVRDAGTTAYDADALHDILRQSARTPTHPLLPPLGSRGIGQMLDEARAKIQRVSPVQAYVELRDSNSEIASTPPVFLVDIRPSAQREWEGSIHGSLVIERNVLEWRLDPRSDARLAIADRYDLRVIVFCQEGYTSSLAAYSLQQLGLLNATDVIGGFKAWKDAGLSVDMSADKPKMHFLTSLAGSVV